MRKSVSVAMAVCNGEKYLREQIDSVLKQLRDEDELIISLDPSSDKSEEILNSYKDQRIKIYFGVGEGVVKNFENAIKQTRNEIIFLCDQDDVWLENKVEIVLKSFEDNINVVMHDAYITNENLKIKHMSFFSFRKTRTGVLKNILKNSYIGCCMAFKSDLKPYILPFPKNIPMHDQWIGIIGEKRGKNKLVKQPLLLYRRHKNNSSGDKHSSLIQMIKWRYILIKSLRRIKNYHV